MNEQKMKSTDLFPKCQFALRQTGNSILMGLVKVSPGEFNNYVNELDKVVAEWQKSSIRTSACSSTDRPWEVNKDTGELRCWSNPKHFFKTYLYTIFGSWDLAHLTLTFDQGLATRLPYVGHANGQQMYFLNDLSLSLPVGAYRMGKSTSKKDFSFFDALKKIGVTYCVEHESREELEKTVEGRQEAEKLIVRDLVDGQGSGAYYTVVPSPFVLDSIKNVAHRGCGDKIGEDSTTFRSEGSLVKDTDLLAVFQVNKNTNFKLKFSKENRALIFIFLVFKLAEFWENQDPNSEITYVKPFFTDNFFDIVIVCRGTNFKLMKKMVEHSLSIQNKDIDKIYNLTTLDKEDDRIALFDREYAKNTFAQARSPLYLLSYNFEGLSYGSLERIQEEISKYCKPHTDNICPHDDGQSTANNHCDAGLHAKCVADALENTWRHFEKGQQLGVFGDRSTVLPSVLLTVQSQRYGQVLCQLDLWAQAVKKVYRFDNEPNVKELHGRYTFEVRFIDKIKPDRFFVAFSFLTYLLSRKCFAEENALKFYPIEYRKMMNPVLQINTRIQATPMARKEYHFSLTSQIHEHYRGHTCVLNRIKILQICYDSLISMKKVTEGERKGKKKPNKNSIYKNLCESLRKILDINQAEPFQTAFSEFLQKRFLGQVTPETLELLASTFCAIDTFVSNQISYHLFFDLRKYAIEFLQVLFSVHQARDTEGGCREFYWDSSNDVINQCKIDKQSNIQYLEYQITNFISTIEKISGQKLSGSYPQHDRNFSRLADIRFLQIKKIQAISWLINSYTDCFAKTYKTILQNHAQTLGLTFETQSLLNSIPHHLALFSNSQESILNRQKRTIEISVRDLASIEGLTLVAHEIGHIIADFLNSQREPANDSEPSTSLLDFLKTKNRNEFRELGDLLTCGDIFSKKSQTTRQQRQQYEKIFSQNTWDELFCDLYACNISMVPLEKFYSAENFKYLCPSINSQSAERIKNYMEEYDCKTTEKHDLIDDYALSFIAQIVMLPQIRSLKGFYSLLVRITVMLGIVKYHKNQECFQSGAEMVKLFKTSPEEVEKNIKKIWGKLVEPFYHKKLLPLLKLLFARESEHIAKLLDPEIKDFKVDQKKYNNKIQQTRLLNDLKLTLMKNAGEIPESDGEVNGYIIGNFMEDMESAFAVFFNHYLQEIKGKNPFFIYLHKLASLDGVQKGGKNGMLKDISCLYPKMQDAFLVRQGLVPKDLAQKDAIDSFSHALQLCSTINLRFSIFSKNEHLIVHGHRGFKKHAAQQYLARSRRLAISFLWDGALKSIGEEIGEINSDHDEWWSGHGDSMKCERPTPKQSKINACKELISGCPELI